MSKYLDSVPDIVSMSSDDVATPWGPTPPPLSLSPKSRAIAKNTSHHHHNIHLNASFATVAEDILCPTGSPAACKTLKADFDDDFDNNEWASCTNRVPGHPEICLEPNGTAPVRVVQIFNPVLVKTDVTNFRTLVQKLTGKSGCSKYWSKLRRLNSFQQGAMVELEGEGIMSVLEGGDCGHEVSDHHAAADDGRDAHGLMVINDDHEYDPSSSSSSSADSSFNYSPSAGDCKCAALRDQNTASGEHQQYEMSAACPAPPPEVICHSKSAFTELDIYAGLVSDGPLPDITMLPPLFMSVCT